jgi:CRP-like cAMP-binding protein
MSAATPYSPSGQTRDLIESAGIRCTVTRYRKGEALFFQGDPCDTVLHIESGLVGLEVVTAGGKQAIVGILGPGAFLGEEVLSESADVARRQTAIALTATEVLVVPRRQMLRLVRTQPTVLARFVAHILERHARLQEDLTNQILHTGERRLAHALLSLARHGRGSSPGELPDVSQEFIAEMVGTTRPRVNALIGKFKRQGFLTSGRGVLQIRPTLLQLAADLYKRGADESSDRSVA